MSDQSEKGLQQFEQSLIAWSKIIKLNAEQEIAKVTLSAILGSIQVTSNLLGWLLGVTGVTLTLVVGNLSAVSSAVDQNALSLAVVVFLASGFCGFISKGLSVYISIIQRTNQELEQLIISVLEKYRREQDKIEEIAGAIIRPPDASLDLGKIVQEISEQFNFLERTLVKASFEKGNKDPLYSHKRGIWFARWHGYFLICQIILLACGYLILALNLK